MSGISEAVRYHLGMVSELCKARMHRRSARLPVFDLTLRIWWHTQRIRNAEAVKNG